MSLKAAIREAIDDATSAVLTDHIVNEATEAVLSEFAPCLLAAERLASVVEEFLSSVDRAAAVEGDWDRLTVPPVRAALSAWKDASK